MAEVNKLRTQLASTTLEAEERARLTTRLQQLERSIGRAEEAKVRQNEHRPELLDRLAKAVAERKALQSQVQSRPAGSEEQQVLSDRIETLDRQVEMLEMMGKDQPEMMAQWMVGPWKFNRELYRQYGGMVIWQQAGIEPLDAYKQFLEWVPRATLR